MNSSGLTLNSGSFLESLRSSLLWWKALSMASSEVMDRYARLAMPLYVFIRDSENFSKSYCRLLRHSRHVHEIEWGRGISWPLWVSIATISYRSFWQANVSGVTPGANWESSMEWSKMAMLKERTSILSPFSWSRRSRRCLTNLGWLVSTATSRASWIWRKSNLTPSIREVMISSLPSRMERFNASLHNRSSDSSSWRMIPSPRERRLSTQAMLPSWMAGISSSGKWSFLFTISRQLSGCSQSEY